MAIQNPCIGIAGLEQALGPGYHPASFRTENPNPMRCDVFRSLPALCLLLALPAGAASAGEPALLGHAIELRLNPATHQIAGRDSIRLAEPVRELYFSLHEALTPAAASAGVTLQPAPAEASVPDEGDGPSSTEGLTLESDEGLKHWLLTSEEPRDLWIVSFEGELFQDASQVVFGREKVGAEIRATVGEQGVFLAGGAGWYPLVGEGLQAHRVSTTLPAGWRSLTQGQKISEELVKDGWARTTWDAPLPSDGVNLVANRFRIDSRKHGDTLVETYFFPEDSSLAAGYLDACLGYLDLYESFLGPYPYGKFAVVENFFPTGYGMPSWTLLGQQVLRLPFIKHTSLGHEIAHNWWGNSVFVGEGGNWCEGLTVYTADYLYKARQSDAAARQYRKNTLKSYTHYTRDGKDFPLADFVSRHDSATRAVGYGKSMFIFHLLEELVGRDAFRAALRRVVAERQWSEATWADFYRAVEVEGGLAPGALEDERVQWIDHAGSPLLSLGEVRADEHSDVWRLHFELRQEGGPFHLRVPVHIETVYGAEAITVELTGESGHFERHLAARPVALSVDPDYHVFRRLHEDEMESTLSLVMADEDPLFLLADGVTGDLAEAFRDFAASFVEGEPRIALAAAARGSIEKERTLIWLGKAPPAFREAPAGLKVTPMFTVFQGQRFEPGAHALVYTAKRPGGGFLAVLASEAKEVRAIASKVPHYGKYSYLAFETGRNRLKGNWEAAAGPLHRRLD